MGLFDKLSTASGKAFGLCIKFEGNKKKRGRKPKPPPIHTEIKGAVTVK
jgi:hypothetical protein